jgi:hypothetical protein
VIISTDCNDAFTNKTMTRTFFIYIMNNETTYTSENVQAMHAQLPIYVQQICARLEKKGDKLGRRMTRDSVGIYSTALTLH